MKKRLTAWLLVFCMALSLLPGTAFAAENSSEVTITYDLNDLGASTYQLQLQTKSGQKPLNEPGAVWAGRPFAGWSSSPDGKTPPVYDGTKTLYAIWQKGYKVTFDFGTEVTLPTGTDQKMEFTTDAKSMVLQKNLKTLDSIIKEVEAGKQHAFAGWFIDGNEDKPLDPNTQAIPENGATLKAKWTGVYEIIINDSNPSVTKPTLIDKRITDAQGKITGDEIKDLEREGYTFKGWYILKDDNQTFENSKWEDVVIREGATQTTKKGLKIDINKYQFKQALTVIAIWGEPYTITFDVVEDDAYIGTPGTLTVRRPTTEHRLTKVPSYDMPSVPVRPGYTFDGWHTTATGGNGDIKIEQGDEFKPGDTTTPSTLYAHWKEGYAITFECWGAEEGSTDPTKKPVVIQTNKNGEISETQYADLEAKLDDIKSTKKGWVFVGWILKGDPAGKLIDPATLQGKRFTGPETYEGKWEMGYLVQFETNGGSMPGNIKEKRTDTNFHLFLDGEPTKDGAKFGGLYTAADFAADSKVSTGKDAYGVVYYDFSGYFSDSANADKNVVEAYVKWIPPYTITIKLTDGDQMPSGVSTTYTADTPDPSDDTKAYYPETLNLIKPIPGKAHEGYTFNGWVVETSGVPTATPIVPGTAAGASKCDGPVTLRAKWGAPYTIKLDANGGSSTIQEVSAELDTTDGKIKYKNLPVAGDKQVTRPPVSNGGQTTTYTFVGWYTVATGGSLVQNDDVCSGPCTLYARWDEAKTTDSPGSGSTPKPAASKPASVMAGPSAISPFDGGNGGADAAETKVKVTFDPDYTDLTNGQAAPKTEMEVNDEGKLTKDQIDQISKPSRTGYTFLGWFKDGSDTAAEITEETEFKADTTFKAKWQKGYLIHFNLVSTEGDVQPASIPDAWTDTDGILGLRLPVANPAQNYLVREGYTFKGWSTTWPKSDGTTTPDVTDKYKFKEESTIYAVWAESNNFKIKFYLNDGTDTFLERNTNDDGTVQLPSPTRDGYVLLGWFTEKVNGQKLTADRVFDKNSGIYEFYAHWEEEFTVTFHDNYPDGTGSTKTVTGSKTEFELPNDPVLGGYVFTGWYDRNGNGPLVKADINKDTKDLYAHWRAQEVTVILNDPSIDPPTKLKTNKGTLGNALPQLFKEGYEFLGWFTAPDDKGKQVGPSTVLTYDENNDPLNLYAHWRPLTDKPDPNSHVVHFIVDKAVETDPSKAAHFTMIADTDGKYLSQTPVLVNYDAETDGWIDGEGIRVDRAYDFTDPNTNVYINMAKKYPITFDWNNAGVHGTVSDKEVIFTNLNGIIPDDQWPDSKAAEMYPDSSFKGWYTAATGGKQVAKTAPFDAATTLYAQWDSPYWITFDANGGKFADGETTLKVKTDLGGYLASAEVPADPTIDSICKFMGWGLTKDAKPEEAVNPATDKQPYDKPTVLYAIWGPPYKIEYQVNGGNALTPTPEQSRTTDDGKFPTLPVPEHSRDAFGGWYTTEDCTGQPVQAGDVADKPEDVTKPIVLYAKWEHNPPYTITFEANQTGATMLDPETGKEVSTLTMKTDDKGVLMKEPPKPTVRGGTFQGWYTKPEEGSGEPYTDFTKPFADDMTLYAHWETREFTITFDFNLGEIMSNPLAITTYTTTKGKTLTFLPDKLPQAASGNYQIKGWYRVKDPVEGKDNPVTTSDTFERDTTLYAQWELAKDLPIMFKYPNVTFLDAENGNALVTLEVDKDYKMSAVPPGPYKEGYTFSGWYYRVPDQPDGKEYKFDEHTEVTGSMRVYAKYIGKGYTITFEPGEESELEPITVTTTPEGRIPDGSIPTDLQWEGHTFTGWYTSAEGGTKVTRRTVFTQDTTVYAHWDKANDPDNPDNPPDKPDKPDEPTSPPYTITFNPNGGNLNANTTVLTDLNGRLTALPTPARTGYRFDGWFNGNERVTTATVFSANTTITATWSAGSSSSDNSSGDITGYAITVANTSGGRVSVSTTYAREGDRVTVTVRPYSGYQLDRVDVTNARGYDVALRESGGNRYVFTMPASRVTVDAVFMELIANNGNNGNNGNNNSNNNNNSNMGNTGGNTNWNPGWNPGGVTSGMGIFSQPVLNTVPMPYLDVHPSDWYYSSVDYMWQRQLMGGVSNNRFGPQATTSNAMVWTILARLAGVDVTSGASVWYENARSWAVSNRISDGVGPNSAVTREQLATMLWNFKGSPSVGYDLGQFGDRGQISTYQAECALSWAVANNIVTGTANRLNPRGTATRAEVAAMITRFCQNT